MMGNEKNVLIDFNTSEITEIINENFNFDHLSKLNEEKFLAIKNEKLFLITFSFPQNQNEIIKMDLSEIHVPSPNPIKVLGFKLWKNKIEISTEKQILIFSFTI